MSTIRINGKTFVGNSVSIINGKVIIDGKETVSEEKVINIHLEGNIDELSADYCDKITINGDANRVKTMSGNVKIEGSVTGDVKTMSGNVKCGDVNGKVKTMSGDIIKK